MTKNQEIQTKKPKVGISTGFKTLDKSIGGLFKGDLTILGGRPEMGKTALITNIAFNIANSGKNVLYFSQELIAEQLATKIMSQQTEISPNKIKLGNIHKNEFEKLSDEAVKLNELSLFIDDSPKNTFNNIINGSNKIKEKHDLDLIIIDYLQTLKGCLEDKSINEKTEMLEIIKKLKELAVDFNVPVVVLSQLPDNVDNRPELGNIRQYGFDLNDVDNVMFIHRPEYNPIGDAPKRKKDESDEDFLERTEQYDEKLKYTGNKAEIIIAKQKNGPVKTVELHIDGLLGKFSDIDDLKLTG